MTEWHGTSAQMYRMHGKETLKVGTDGGQKLCVVGGWRGCLSEKKLSVVCRRYYDKGLLQPRYVMPNLVAKTTRKKKKERRVGKKPHKLL